MEMDVEPRNKEIKDMEDIELDDAVEVTMGEERLKEMFDEKLSKAKGVSKKKKEKKEGMFGTEEEKEEEDDRASNLSDFIEVIVRLKK